MDSRSTVPPVDAQRAAALATDAIADAPLPAEASNSLERAVERLDDAIAQSDAEAQAAR